MKKIVNPNRKEWSELVKRPELDQQDLTLLIENIFTEVKQKGDQALLDFTEKFDGCRLDSLVVSEEEFNSASNQVSSELKKAIQLAERNINKFHQSQLLRSEKIQTQPGVVCWREARGIEKVGLYIPGGSAPLFSTILMLAVPAKIAGCEEIILCTPPDTSGAINPAILYTAQLTGITRVFKVGGAQAIAAMGIGTETIPNVYKVFGPGNQYVTKAKELIQQRGIAIDMPAGPSEVLIIADNTCVPAFLAADLLSQAEHGADSQVILLSDNDEICDQIMEELENQLSLLPRKEIAEQALQNSSSITLANISECLDFSNLYAPEHLILASERAESMLSRVKAAGSVFVGNYSCESAGDYASGTNHTLPTNGFARNYSGVSLDSFINKITFQSLNPEGIKNIGPAIEIMAEAEELFAHKNAVTLRLKSLKS